MLDFSKQIIRIEQKLAQARDTDTDFRVFGASSHNYQINQPLQIKDIRAFEEKYSVLLPRCYQAFLLNIGNGGNSYQDSGTGPFYGIYPLGRNINELIHSNPEVFLKEKCILHPKLTEEDWDDLNKFMDDENISDEDYYKEVAKIYSGILPIGFQGCSALHAIVLNGTHKGKVINVDKDGSKPNFTFENNFLDWYERWLDEIISGHLIKAPTSWFGYGKKDEE